jgi:phage terminase large subunit
MMLPEKKRDVFVAPWRPLEWQQAPLRDESRIVLLTGSAGGGKSRVAAEKLHAFCHHYDGAMALAVRKTRNSMTNSTVLFMERAVIGDDPAVRHFPSKNRFEYSNGSILAYGGMANEEQREQIRSIGQEGALDIVWMEEATGFTEADFNELGARMRGRAAWRQIILTTNPAGPRHWINVRLIGKGEAQVYYSAAKDNPHNPEEYQTFLDNLTGVLRLRLRDGQWRAAEGAIYDEFSREIHVQERDRGEFRRFVVGVDEGHVNPMVALVHGMDNDERLHAIEEFYQGGILQETFVGVCRDLAARYRVVDSSAAALVMAARAAGYEPLIPQIEVQFVVDPSAKGLIMALRAAGLRVSEAHNAVGDGIQEVKARLRVQADGRPRLTVDPSCVNTISEFESYVWAKARDGVSKDAPVKQHDHAMDAARYACMAVRQAAPFLYASV